MCDTPPLENRKITRLAFAGKCGPFGVSGSSLRGVLSSAASNCERMPGKSSEVPARERSTARRFKKREGMWTPVKGFSSIIRVSIRNPLVHVDQLTAHEQGTREALPRRQTLVLGRHTVGLNLPLHLRQISLCGSFLVARSEE